VAEGEGGGLLFTVEGGFWGSLGKKEKGEGEICWEWYIILSKTIAGSQLFFVRAHDSTLQRTTIRLTLEREKYPTQTPPLQPLPLRSLIVFLGGGFQGADLKKREVCGCQWVRKSWQGGGKKANRACVEKRSSILRGCTGRGGGRVLVHCIGGDGMMIAVFVEWGDVDVVERICA